MSFYRVAQCEGYPPYVEAQFADYTDAEMMTGPGNAWNAGTIYPEEALKTDLEFSKALDAWKAGDQRVRARVMAASYLSHVHRHAEDILADSDLIGQASNYPGVAECALLVHVADLAERIRASTAGIREPVPAEPKEVPTREGMAEDRGRKG